VKLNQLALIGREAVRGYVFEQWVFAVFFGEQGIGYGPLDAYIRIRPDDAAFVIGSIEISALVSHHSPFAQNAKSMGKSFRDKDLAPTLAVELEAGPLAEGGRSRANVHGYIKNPACENLDQFSLVMGVLIVQPSHGTTDRIGQVVLDKGYIDAVFTVLFLVEGFHEKTALVGEDIGFDDEDAFQGCFKDFHVRRLKTLKSLKP